MVKSVFKLYNKLGPKMISAIPINLVTLKDVVKTKLDSMEGDHLLKAKVRLKLFNKLCKK